MVLTIHLTHHLLHIMGEKVRNHICDLFHSAGVFSILVDESKDFSKQEQMSFVVRFADMGKGEIHEHFLCFVEAKSLDAPCISRISLLDSV